MVALASTHTHGKKLETNVGWVNSHPDIPMGKYMSIYE
jgi:hypothetical protein